MIGTIPTAGWRNALRPSSRFSRRRASASTTTSSGARRARINPDLTTLRGVVHLADPSAENIDAALAGPLSTRAEREPLRVVRSDACYSKSCTAHPVLLEGAWPPNPHATVV
jgi:hypothetical protein